MKVTLDQKTLQFIDLFRKLTGANPIDCITEEDCIYFIISKGEYGLAVGKNGSKIKNAERIFKKPIKVFEYSETAEGFIKNLVSDIQEFTVEGKTLVVRVGAKDRAKIIGKGGKNIRLLNQILQRLFDIEEIKVK